MWYFAWLLGLPLAAMFAVVNAMWLELQEDSRMINDQGHNGETGRARR
jgi:cyd operon protein YbgT